jgi:hypothetical protein
VVSNQTLTQPAARFDVEAPARKNEQGSAGVKARLNRADSFGSWGSGASLDNRLCLSNIAHSNSDAGNGGGSSER